jgi:hypothetical protein
MAPGPSVANTVGRPLMRLYISATNAAPWSWRVSACRIFQFADA